LSAAAVAIVCKTPAPGRSKTRLSPPLRPQECAAISACFIQDLAATIGGMAADGDVTGYALYTPRGSEQALRRLLPERFELAPQCDGDFGMRLIQGTRDLLNLGHRGVILVNSDSPTLPQPILRAAVDATLRNDCVVLGPAFDGGYTLIGVSKPHARLFEDIPWSTGTVYARTLERAQELGLSVHNVPGWYDVDDEESLRMLEEEFSGRPPGFSALAGAAAPMTRRFLKARTAALAEPAAMAP
jgi:rSAM/selenodomain-associated transferase 1